MQWEASTNSTVNGTGNIIVFRGEAEGQTPNGSKFTAVKKDKMRTEFFFKLMKKKFGTLANMRYENRIKKVEALMKQAEKDGQTAFSEELMRHCLVLVREAEMYANGYKMFLEKKQYDDFCYKVDRPISLTPIANYARPIPDDVLKKKRKVDDLKLFDSYLVMHADKPGVKKKTEKERAKDPILFGRVEYSDKLYFIADWEDEYCDLTMEDIVDILDLEDEDVTMGKNPSLPK